MEGMTDMLKDIIGSDVDKYVLKKEFYDRFMNDKVDFTDYKLTIPSSSALKKLQDVINIEPLTAAIKKYKELPGTGIVFVNHEHIPLEDIYKTMINI